MDDAKPYKECIKDMLAMKRQDRPHAHAVLINS